MSETRHTPGPWRSVHRSSGADIEAAGKVVAHVPWLDAEGMANARLIAAAPELLEALERLESLTRHGWHGADRESIDGQYFAGGLKRAQEAIAKAKGET